MTERLKRRLTALEQKILPFEPEGLEHDQLNFMLTTYSECDRQLQGLPNYKDLKTKVDKAILQWYGEWYASWLKSSEEEKKKLLAAIHCSIREEFLKIRKEIKNGEKLCQSSTQPEQ